MKKKFAILTLHGQTIPPGSLATPVLCTRCGDEYISKELVYGYRDGDSECQLFCRNDNCYGRWNAGVYARTVSC